MDGYLLMTTRILRPAFPSNGAHASTRDSVGFIVMLIPALLLAAEGEGASISDMIKAYRRRGLGGERACRKLLHRLEALGCVQVSAGESADRREKTVRLTPNGRSQIGRIAERLSRLSVNGESDEHVTRALYGC